MPRLIILGSSSGLASAYRAASSYLLDLGTHGVLLDCGDGATRNFRHAGFLTEWVKRIVITHTHSDHIGGLPYFLQQRYLSGTKSPLAIHCPTLAATELENVLAFHHLYSERFPFVTRIESLVPRCEIDAGGVVLTPFPTTHLDSIRPGEQDESFAIRIAVKGEVIVYSSDIGRREDLDAIPGPIDSLLVETTHVPLGDLWPWVKQRRIARVILTHLADDFDLSIVERARRETDAEVLVAADEMVLDLGRKPGRETGR